MIILSFNTINEAQTAAKQIWINIIKDAVSQGETVRNGGIPHVDLSGFDDDYIYTLQICGTINTQTEFNKGLTNKYAQVRKAWNLNKWYIPTAVTQYLVNVIGYTEQSLPDSWHEPLPIS